MSQNKEYKRYIEVELMKLKIEIGGIMDKAESLIRSINSSMERISKMEEETTKPG